MERGGGLQISTVFAKIVTDFWLETNGYRLGFRT
jgi:hypothetical protein